jgi:hypothetical protein
VPLTNEIIVGGLQRNREELASTDESAVAFLLNTVMSPTRLTELGELDEGSNLPLEYGKIGATSTGVVVPLGIGTLCYAQSVSGLCSILPAKPYDVCLMLLWCSACGWPSFPWVWLSSTPVPKLVE